MLSALPAERRRLVALVTAGAVGITAAYLMWRKFGPHRHHEDDMFSHDAAGISGAVDAQKKKTGRADVSNCLDTASSKMAGNIDDPERQARRAQAAAKREAALEFANGLLLQRRVSLDDEDDDEDDEEEKGDDGDSYKTDPPLEYRIGLTMEGIMREDLLKIVDKLTKLQSRTAPGGSDEGDLKAHQKVRKLENNLLVKAREYLNNTKMLDALRQKHGARVYDDPDADEDQDDDGDEARALEMEWNRYAGGQRGRGTRDTVLPTSRAAQLTRGGHASSYADEADFDGEMAEDAAEDSDDEAAARLERRMMRQKQCRALGWADDAGDDNMDEDEDDEDWGDEEDEENDWMFENEDDEDEDMLMLGEEQEEEEDDMDVGYAEMNMNLFESQLVEHLLRIRESQEAGASADGGMTTSSVHKALEAQEEASSAIVPNTEDVNDDDDDNWIDEDEEDGAEEDDDEAALQQVRTKSNKSSKGPGRRGVPWIDV